MVKKFVVFLFLAINFLSSPSIAEISIKDMEMQVKSHLARNDFFEAAKIQNEIVRHYENENGEDSISTIKPRETLAWMNIGTQNYPEAEALYKKSIKIRKGIFKPTLEQRANLYIALYMLGDAHMYQNQFDEALALYDESNEVVKGWFPKGSGDVISRKGRIYEKLDDDETAVKYYLEAAEAYEDTKNYKPENSEQLNKRITDKYKVISDLYDGLGMDKEAKKYNELWIKSGKQNKN